MASIPNYKPKSEASKSSEREKKLPIVSGKVSPVKETSLKKFVKGFMPDSSTSLTEYVASEAPKLIKNLGRSLLLGLIDTYLPGDSIVKSITSKNGLVEYNKISRSNLPADKKLSSVYSYTELVFELESEAQIVLDQLYLDLDTYHVVRVADLFDYAGTPTNPSDNDYGWTSLAGSYIKRVPEGWTIVLPRAKAL